MHDLRRGLKEARISEDVVPRIRRLGVKAASRERRPKKDLTQRGDSTHKKRLLQPVNTINDQSFRKSRLVEEPVSGILGLDILSF